MEIVYIAVGIARTKDGMPGMASASGVGSLTRNGSEVEEKTKVKPKMMTAITMS